VGVLRRSGWIGRGGGGKGETKRGPRKSDFRSMFFSEGTGVRGGTRRFDAVALRKEKGPIGQAGGDYRRKTEGIRRGLDERSDSILSERNKKGTEEDSPEKKGRMVLLSKQKITSRKARTLADHIAGDKDL